MGGMIAAVVEMWRITEQLDTYHLLKFTISYHIHVVFYAALWAAVTAVNCQLQERHDLQVIAMRRTNHVSDVIKNPYPNFSWLRPLDFFYSKHV